MNRRLSRQVAPARHPAYKRPMWRIGLFCAVLASLAGGALAHPHVFIEHRVTLLFGEAGLEALRVEWTFDELYSASLIADFLGNKKSQPTAAQRQVIEQQAFAAAEDANYFLVLKLDGKQTKVGRHKDFNADLDGPKMRYRFVVPVTANTARRLTVNGLDETWYIDFFPPKSDAVRAEAPTGTAVDCTMETEPQKTALGVVDTMIATCRW
jgi:ABC-type uncharacterized transport system substrate-binding protein